MQPAVHYPDARRIPTGIHAQDMNRRNAMLPYQKTFITWCLISGLVMLPFGTLAATADGNQVPEKNSPEAMTTDFILVRPLGLVATLCGSVIFLVSSPFSAMGGNTQEAWDALVAEPAAFTFKRPLGHFEESK